MKWSCQEWQMSQCAKAFNLLDRTALRTNDKWIFSSFILPSFITCAWRIDWFPLSKIKKTENWKFVQEFVWDWRATAITIYLASILAIRRLKIHARHKSIEIALLTLCIKMIANDSGEMKTGFISELKAWAEIRVSFPKREKKWHSKWKMHAMNKNENAKNEKKLGANRTERTASENSWKEAENENGEKRMAMQLHHWNGEKFIRIESWKSRRDTGVNSRNNSNRREKSVAVERLQIVRTMRKYDGKYKIWAQFTNVIQNGAQNMLWVGRWWAHTQFCRGHFFPFVFLSHFVVFLHLPSEDVFVIFDDWKWLNDWKWSTISCKAHAIQYFCHSEWFRLLSSVHMLGKRFYLNVSNISMCFRWRCQSNFDQKTLKRPMKNDAEKQYRAQRECVRYSKMKKKSIEKQFSTQNGEWIVATSTQKPV